MRRNDLARHNRRGAMLILVALVLVIIMIGTVFSVDVAYMHMVRAELRVATDAAARAGSETLARTQDPGTAVRAAIDIAERNQVAGDGLTVTGSDIQLGTIRPSSASNRFQFTPNRAPLTAVKVDGRRDAASRDGEVGLFFAKFFSVGSFAPTETAIAASSVRDVALVLDVSGSMNARSGRGTRISALQDAVRAFLAEVRTSSPSTQISLSVYASRAAKLVDLTPDFNLIQSVVDRIRARGATAIGNGLLMGSDSLVNDPLQREFAAKTVIVMTDGQHNRGPSPLTTVATAVSRGHQVHTVTFGRGANQNLMRRVAQATDGGFHIHADDASDLTTAFREIARSLSVVLVE